MDKYKIAIGQSRTTKIWKNTEITWDELVERLATTTRTSESVGEYKNLTKSQRDQIKDVGGFVGGNLINGSRKASCIDKRYLLTLDLDYATADFCDTFEMLFDYQYIIYSTHSHSAEGPRLRLVLPFDRTCSADEYEAVGRRIAELIGIDMFDDTTYQAHRLMYYPSTSLDGDYVFNHGEGKQVLVDDVLSTYTDWTDSRQYPVSSRATKALERLTKKQQDPCEKTGIVGAFCRSHSIQDVMDTFLSDVYTPCDAANRYTYTAGSTTAGVVLYDDKFSYSNHATDPTSGVLCNAFDLVRLHKFAALDDEVQAGTPAVKLPSYIAMQDFCTADSAVKTQIYKERTASIDEDFACADLDHCDESVDWVLDLAVDSKGRYASPIDNIKILLLNEPKLKGMSAFNEFTLKSRVRGKLPWDKNSDERDWSDADDAGLRHFLEKTYAIKGKSNIDDAWILSNQENRYHPVKQYLDGVAWDGIPRADMLFIDYLGAEDNAYTRAATRASLLACVARIYCPGAKHDTMMVLVGEQGCGKSQIIKRLGGDWFSDTLTSIQDKEAYEQIQGFWIIEVAELSAMKKYEVEQVKHFISKSEDAFRAAYGRRVDTHKRQCFFLAPLTTTNS